MRCIIKLLLQLFYKFKIKGNLMRKSLLTVAVLGALATPMLSHAEEPASPHSISYNVGLYSQYIFRGLTQTDSAPALQGGVDYAHDSGFYIGAWGSNISWLSDADAYDSSSIEIDVYGGYGSEFGETGIGYDVGILQYFYPGDRLSGTNNAETTELYAGLSYGWASAKYSYAISDTFGFDDSEGSWYAEIGVDIPVGDTGLTVSAHYGRQEFDGSGNDASDYTDWKLGLAKAWDNGVEVGGYYTDTNNAFEVDGHDDVGDSEFTVYVSKSF